MTRNRILWSLATIMTLVLTAALVMPTVDAASRNPAQARAASGQTAGNNRCDQKHPDRGNDRKGHNNPKGLKNNYISRVVDGV